MSIDSFDDLEDTLGLDNQTGDTGGQDIYSPEELLTDSFVQTNTEFDSASAFLDALPDYDNLDDYLECDEVQTVVDEKTDFDNYDQMLDEAAVDDVKSEINL